jgi:small-conductance mechanosensitive channel
VTVIGLIGWTTIVALQVSAAAYLRRFRLDVDDNLLARKHNTQVQILLRVVDGIIVLVTIGAALMTIPSVRQYGISLFASAGIAGIAAGLAARPVLSNLLAGVQLAMTQPIRLYDSVGRVWHGRRNRLYLCDRQTLGSAAHGRAAELFH